MITYQYIEQLIATAHMHGVEVVDLIVKDHDLKVFESAVAIRYTPHDKRFVSMGKADFHECTIAKYMYNGTIINFWVLKFLPV